jgi:tellurite resistance protein TehA-like permease
MRGIFIVIAFGVGWVAALYVLAFMSKLLQLSERMQQRMMPVVGVLFLVSFVYLAKYEGGGHPLIDWTENARR